LEPGQVLIANLNQNRVNSELRKFHHWEIAPDPELNLDEAVERAEELVAAAVERQMESDVPLGALLSGGIDSSLVSAAAQKFNGGMRTFNVRFPDKAYDETWAALAVAKHIGSEHETLNVAAAEGTWDNATDLLKHAGQPFADTSLFAVNAVCGLIRRYVTVALSGDGGDEGFGGYSHYSEIAKILQLQRIPAPFWYAATGILAPLAYIGIVPSRIPLQLSDLVGADDTAVVQNLFSYVRTSEYEQIFRPDDVLPARRLFEPQWTCNVPNGNSRLERLSAHATEINIRLTLANDFLFKVDTASMRESLEVRVPMLDEDLFQFALTLPHELKVKNGTGKRILREIARRKLPLNVAEKPKMGFAIPVDTWLNQEFRDELKECLLGPGSRLPEFFRPEAYRPLVKSFCSGRSHAGLSRRESYGRIIMLLSVHLAIANPS
jgi:asparagine synthase (glutamine-hydrolysing)